MARIKLEQETKSILNTSIENIETKKEEIQYENDVNSEAYNNFMMWLNEQLENLKKYSTLSDDPQFVELNKALAHHEHIMLAMLSTYNMLRYELTFAKREYETKFAELFMQVRDEHNTQDIAASKYLGQKEIEYIVISKYKHILTPIESKKDKIEVQMSALKSMIDSWNTYNYTLGTLSKNIQIEISTTVNSKADLFNDAPSPVDY